MLRENHALRTPQCAVHSNDQGAYGKRITWTGTSLSSFNSLQSTVRTAVPNMTQPASSCELVGPVLDFQIRYLKAAKPFENVKTCHIKSCQISGSYYEAPNVSLCPVTEPKQCHTGCERSYSHSDLAILGPGSWIIRECQATNVNINNFA